MPSVYDNTTKNLMLEGLEAAVKLGSAHTNPRMCWYAGSTLLAQVDLDPNQPFDPAATGAITLNAVAAGTEWAALSITPSASGDCDSIQIQDRDYVTRVNLSGASMGLSPINITTATPLTFISAPSWNI
jgi:hypothetical protein